MTTKRRKTRCSRWEGLEQQTAGLAPGESPPAGPWERQRERVRAYAL